MNGVADRETLRGQDVGLGAVGIFQQCDKGGAVRIVFERSTVRRHIDLGALEVDDAVGLLVAGRRESARPCGRCCCGRRWNACPRSTP